MKKKYIKRLREINARFNEMADLLEKEKRSLTAEEAEEKRALEAEKNAIELRLLQLDLPQTPETVVRGQREDAFAKVVRFMKNGGNIEEEYRSLVKDGSLVIPVTRAIQDSTTTTDITPLTIGEIIEPLEKGLILSKLGLKMQYGITGAWQFPVVAGGVEATIEDENVEIGDTSIDISKLSPSPKRVSIAIPVSNRAIDQSSGVILDIVRTQLSLSVSRLLNKWMFNKTQLSKASDGCFVKAYATPAVTCAGDTPTWAEVLKIEAAALEKGVILDNTACWVCSASMVAKLKSAPKDAGSGRFIMEDGKIDGYPVFVTEYVEKDMLGFGVFSYELVGQFGEMRMTVDSSSAAVAKKNLTYFVFNSDYDMLTLREEAFAVGKTTPAA